MGFNPTNTQTGHQFAPPPQQPKKSNKIPIIIGVVVLLVFAGLGLAYNIKINKPQQATPNQPLAKTTPTPNVTSKQDTPKTDPETTPTPKPTKTLKFRVRTTPSEADIFDGSQFIATTPHTLTLTADGAKKVYTIRLKKYKDADITVDPKKPEDNFFDIDLVPANSKRKQARVKIRRTKQNKATSKSSTKSTEKSTAKGGKTATKGDKPATTDTTPKEKPTTKPKDKPVIERLDDNENNKGIDRLP